jgi:hypothetical protein
VWATVTEYVTGAVSFPTSYTCTQYEPAETVPDNCAVALAGAIVESPCFMGRDLCKPGAGNTRLLAGCDDLSCRQTDAAASFLEDSDDSA